MRISETTTVAEIASALPSSVRVFQQHGIDFCCGGRKPIGAACRERGLDFDELARAIGASARSTADAPQDWSREPLGTLTAHIVTTYHRPLDQELPRLRTMASKVAQVHGARSANLVAIAATVEALAADLQSHMRKEEGVLFPAIQALEAGTSTRPAGLGAPIAVMEHEHERAGVLLAELRSLTDAYQVPEWGCATMRALFHALGELESAMHVHVHLENNILFPRARAAAEARVDAGARAAS